MRWRPLPLLAVLSFVSPSSRALAEDGERRGAGVRAPAMELHPGAPLIALGLFGAVAGSAAMVWGTEEIATELGQGIGNTVACVFGCIDPPRPVDEASPLAAPAVVAGMLIALVGLGTLIYGVVVEEDPSATPIVAGPSPGAFSLGLSL